jgi:uncharacterized protein (UPF0548 family)
MYSFFKPAESQIRTFIAAQQTAPFSYSQVGTTATTPPPQYVIDHNRVCLGTGRTTYDRATAAIRRWEMFSLNWVTLCWPSVPIEIGSTVAVLAHALGLWSLNACRIVYLIEEIGEIEKFGFAYGTLPDHAERGEERFQVEWCHEDDTVWYDILAFSRPNQLPAKIAKPYARTLQKRFAIDSKQAMLRAVR